MGIKAIETRYKGYKFRSRLEARWAVFFDTLGIEWEYEPEGFDMDGVRYLPDFYLPQHRIWIEIKGDLLTTDATQRTSVIEKAMALCSGRQERVLLIYGQIGIETTHYATFCPLSDDKVRIGLYSVWAECPSCPYIGPWFWDTDFRDEESITHLDIGYLLAHISPCPRCGAVPEYLVIRDKVVSAFEAARSARFEHGESPRVHPAAQSRDGRSGRQ